MNSTSQAAVSGGKKTDSGKRRQGREMALQMLFQWEAASTHPAEVLRAFDISLYQSETASQERGGAESEPADDEANSAQTDVTSVASDQEPVDSDQEVDDIDARREAARRKNVERQLDVHMGAKARSRAYQFAKTLFLGVVEHSESLDSQISARAENWRLERMSRVDRNILRMALYEATVQQELPKAVVIDEAIELAKRFGGENSGSFVNGILDNLLTAN